MSRHKAPKLSIVLPYLSQSSCIAACLELLSANTETDHEISAVVAPAGAYEAYNAAAAKATGDILIFLNDDMFVPPGWDTPMVKATEAKCLVTGYVVEPGRHRVNHRNVERNFGLDSVSFD